MQLKEMDEDIHFYTHAGLTGPAGSLPNGLRWELWRPASTRVVPSGCPLIPFAIWWLFHFLRIFRNRDYGILLISTGDTIVHRSVIFPPYFRFPCMRDEDLQVGDIWTNGDHRGQGLASFALRQILRSDARPGRRFWYITESSNTPSIHLAESAGFTKFAFGARTSRFGSRLLGSFVIQKVLARPPERG